MFDNETKLEKVAVYLRVSTEDQAKEGYSLDAQKRKLEAYCISRDWKIHEIYIDDGYSGRNIRRPAYTKMFVDVKHWDGILCLKMDRMHRNQKNFISMMELLKKYDKEFISSQESFDTSNAMGRFVMNIIQGIAQLESEQNAERVTMAMVQKAQDLTKGPVGHKLAFGYETVSKGIFKEVPEKLELIKRVFDLYSEGKSMSEISELVDRNWSQIRYWLNNIWYVGYEQWGNCFKKLNNNFQPPISVDLWNQVQTRKRQATNYEQDEGNCRCGSSNMVKAGLRGNKQRWKCKDCGYRFVIEPEKPGPKKAFILDGYPDSFTLSDKEMKDYGFGMDIIQNQVK